MKKSICLIALICLLFAGCNKVEDESLKEDLSYLIQTYNRNDQNGTISKTIRTFNGYKETSLEYYVGGQLYQERKNYLYNGLKASWDIYTYQIDAINSENTRQHIECEYLDDTYLREKYRKTEYYYEDPQRDHITEYYSVYDGKKIVSQKYYSNSTLSYESYDYNYEGLRCTHKWTHYNSGYPDDERNYIIEYLDDTYLRQKSSMYTRERYNSDGQLISSSTSYTVYDYDGKKVIGSQSYSNGKLLSMSRDYHYDGLTCYYYVDKHNNDGEVTSTTSYEVEYLE